MLFRDYGLNDHAMQRFKAANRLGKNFYVRQDGTRSYFFSKGQFYYCKGDERGGNGSKSQELVQCRFDPWLPSG